jgi:hypothetical protein
MIYVGRMLDRPETDRTFEADSSWQAPDEYVAAHCKHDGPGLCFVEVRRAVEPAKFWQLWRVEILQAGPPLIMMTAKTTEAKARAELAKKPA